MCTKDNIFQRFIIDGERFKNYQDQFMRESRTILFAEINKLNYVVWDIETDLAQLDWATMIEIGAILLDEKL